MDLAAQLWAGEQVVLRGVEPGDWEAFLEFESSSLYQRAWERVTAPRSAENCRQWLSREAAKDPSDDNRILVITDRASGAVVGCVNVTQADPIAGRFNAGVMIGPEHHRKGYAREAIILGLGYMFAERRYQKCQVYIHDFNEASQALVRGIGFILEGRLRRHDFFGGRYHDNLIFGLTAEEYFAAHGTAPNGASRCAGTGIAPRPLGIGEM
jgi:RimJ/RimL family protein N-acetyltransferase